MQRLADIRPRTSLVSGVRESTPAVERRSQVTRLHSSPSVCTSHVTGRTDTTSRVGRVPNRNSFGTTCNCEVPTKSHDVMRNQERHEGLSVGAANVGVECSNDPR